MNCWCHLALICQLVFSCIQITWICLPMSSTSNDPPSTLLQELRIGIQKVLHIYYHMSGDLFTFPFTCTVNEVSLMGLFMMQGICLFRKMHYYHCKKLKVVCTSMRTIAVSFFHVWKSVYKAPIPMIERIRMASKAWLDR